jgi:hypothetical protein
MRKFYLFFLGLLITFISFAQTTIISPTGDGGFESGPDFTSNGWTVVNTATVNGSQWFLATAPLSNSGYGFTPTGTRAAYASNNNGAGWQYNTSAASSSSHIYRNVTFPSGETAINLSFRWNANGESTWDVIYVYLCPQTLTPVANSPSSSTSTVTWTGTGAATLLGSFNLLPAGNGQSASIVIPAGVAGNAAAASNMRLVFTWKNDGSGGGEPPAAIDDISLVSQTPSPLSGVKTINNTLPTGGNNYANFTAAINALNANGIGSGGVTFNVSAGQTFNEDATVIIATGTAASPIVFQKSGSGANPVIRPGGGGGSNDAGIVLSGSDYTTFDGIDINAASSNVEFGYLIRNNSATDGANNNTIRNVVISVDRTNTSSRGILQTASTTGGGFAPTAASGSNSNNKYLNLNISNVYGGVYLLGNSSFPDLNNEIGTTACNLTNTIGNPLVANDLGNSSSQAFGLRVANQSGAKVYNNNVSNVTASTTVDGIFVEAFAGANEVYNNKVSGVRNSSTTSTSIASGIRITHTTTGTHSIRVYNNFVSNITHGFTGTATTSRYIRGINLSGTGGAVTQVYHVDFNSVRIDGSSSPNTSSTALEIATTSGPVFNIRNNILSNFTAAQGATAKHYAFVSTSATLAGNTGSVMSYNDLYIANDVGTSGHVARGNTTNYNTVGDLQTAVTQATNNLSVDPGFNSATDLHATASGLNGAADPAWATNSAWVTNDIDCTTRTGTTDIGADDFNISALDMGVTGLVTPVSSGCYSANETVTVTVRNFGTATIDFAVNPVTVTVNVSGAATQILSTTVNSGTLAAGASTNITIPATLNMSASGTYTFNANTTLAGDGNSANDAMAPVVRSVAPVIALPQSVDFTGFSGTNLNALFPNWQEAVGTTIPSTGNSSWNSSTVIPGSGTTARINLFSAARNEWIVGPTIQATATTQFEMKVAITDWNLSAPYPSGMGSDDKVIVKVSSDCGVTWSDVYTFSSANTATITNNLVPVTIPLGSYNGQKIIIGIFASDGPVDDLNDYDFHIDDISIANVPPCAGAAGGTASTTTSTYCGNASSVVINASGYSTGSGSTYNWQSSPDGVNWTNITGATNPGSFIAANVTATTQYRLRVTCPSGTAEAFSNVITITINPLPAVSVLPASPVNICTGGNVSLTVSGATTYSWSPATGLSATTGATVTASPASTTTYTVTGTNSVTGCIGNINVTVVVNSNPTAVTITPASATQCANATPQLLTASGGNVPAATPVVTNSGTAALTGNPYRTFWDGSKLQFMYTAAELTAAGFSAGSSITSIAFDVTSAGDPLQNLSISMGHTSLTALTSTMTTGLTNVFSSTTVFQPVVGVNTHTFSTPFVWNGTSNILFDVCFAANASGSSSTVKAVASLTSSVVHNAADATTCATTTGTVDAIRPYIILGSLAPSSFTWSPSGSGSGLFTDAAGTVAYTGGASATVYARPTTTTTYTAVATSAAGCTASATATINVTPPPPITSQPASVTVCPGNGASFSVTATGSGLTYQWRKGGTNIAGATGSTYAIASVTAADAGNYDVVVTGSCGSTTSAAAALTVSAAPAITAQPSSQSACVGGSVTFSVTATGDGLTYQWRKAGVNIAGATAATYTIASVVAGDAGNYDVVISGTCAPAVTSNTASLNLNAASVINTQPTNQTGCVGSSVSFSVSASGTGLTYQWRKGGVNIAGATSATYTIPSVVAGDAGNYDVVIGNACGASVTSNTATLTIGTATSITTQPANQAVCIGSPLNLSVVAAGSNLTYQWRKGGVNIAGATSATYTVAAASAADAGTYDVVITGTCGNATSTAVTVTVNPATSITTQPASLTACPGANASFTVTAAGTGLTYQWRKDGVVITGATAATYTVTGVTAASAGTYTVAVTGTCGTVISSGAVLTLGTAPAITTQPQGQGGCSGNAVTFSVVATGTGPLTYQWRKGGANITGATSASYTINNASTADNGNYDVVVTGACGSVTSTVAALNVTGAVQLNGFTGTSNVCLGASASFSVNASAGAGTNLTYQWRKNGVNINGATSASYSIQMVALSDSGNYDVVISNGGACTVTTTAIRLTVNTGGACVTAVPNVDADVTNAVLMPNVISSETMLRIDVRRSMRVDFKLVDANGKTVMLFTRQLNAGRNDFPLSLGGLANGTYYLQGNTNKGRIASLRLVRH